MVLQANSPSGGTANAQHEDPHCNRHANSGLERRRHVGRAGRLAGQADQPLPQREHQYAVNKKVTAGCAEAREYLNEALRNLEKAHKEENKEAIDKYRNIANLEYEFGFEMGCGFAS
jgi:hypothetical protein